MNNEENLKSQLYTSGRAVKNLEYEVGGPGDLGHFVVRLSEWNLRFWTCNVRRYLSKVYAKVVCA